LSDIPLMMLYITTPVV